MNFFGEIRGGLDQIKFSDLAFDHEAWENILISLSLNEGEARDYMVEYLLKELKNFPNIPRPAYHIDGIQDTIEWALHETDLFNCVGLSLDVSYPEEKNLPLYLLRHHVLHRFSPSNIYLPDRMDGIIFPKDMFHPKNSPKMDDEPPTSPYLNYGKEHISCARTWNAHLSRDLKDIIFLDTIVSPFSPSNDDIRQHNISFEGSSSRKRYIFKTHKRKPLSLEFTDKSYHRISNMHSVKEIVFDGYDKVSLDFRVTTRQCGVRGHRLIFDHGSKIDTANLKDSSFARWIYDSMVKDLNNKMYGHASPIRPYSDRHLIVINAKYLTDGEVRDQRRWFDNCVISHASRSERGRLASMILIMEDL